MTAPTTVSDIKAPGFSPVPAHRVTPVRSGDGTTILAHEWGDPEGRPVLFIHGIYQSALTWAHQTSDPALSRHRLVAIDLRGHGGSDKPNDPAAYRDSSRWADDVAQVIGALGLEKPVVVAWSYGGRVINDYLGVHGDDALGGLVYVAARTGETPGVTGQHRDPAVVEASRMLASDDPATLMRGTRLFVAACYADPPSPAEIDALTLASMQTPLYVRRQLVGRPLPAADPIRAIRVPTLIVHGDRDAIVPEAVAFVTMDLVPTARLSLYAGVGHAPFSEARDRFNAELDAFVAMCGGYIMATSTATSIPSIPHATR